MRRFTCLTLVVVGTLGLLSCTDKVSQMTYSAPVVDTKPKRPPNPTILPEIVKSLPDPEVIPVAPEALNAIVRSSSQINLQWMDRSKNERGFIIQRALSATGPFAVIAITSADQTQYQESGLEEISTYFYRVQAFNGAGESPYSNSASATTLRLPPAAPSLLTAKTLSSTNILLNWVDNSSNESSFLIERSVKGSGPFVEIATLKVNATSFSDTQLLSETIYYYRVKAINDGGSSSYSDVVNATTLPNPPSDPIGLMARALSMQSIRLNWLDTSSNETGFEIERAETTGQFVRVRTVSANVSSIEDNGLKIATTYHYRVRAINSGGESFYSNTAVATTFQNPPRAPEGLTVTALSQNQIRLTWLDMSDNELGFQVERFDPKTGMFAEIANVKANISEYIDSGLNPSTTYYYRVCAFHLTNSSYSSVAFTTTFEAPPTAPSNLVAIAYSPTEISLTWVETSNNELGFKIERGNSQTALSEVASVPSGSTRFIDTGLNQGTTYYYRVRAYHSTANSLYSNIANAMTPSGVPRAPTLISALALSGSQISIDWQDNSDNEEGFVLEMTMMPGPTYYMPPGYTPYFMLLGSVGQNVTHFNHDSSIMTAPMTMTYSYRAYAKNKYGNSPYSNILSAQQLPPNQKIETFSGKYLSKVDFLFIMDNTESMERENGQIQKSLNTFISTLESKGTVDYWAAVVDVNAGRPNWHLVKANNGIDVIKAAEMSDPLALWREMIMNLPAGLDHEMGLESVRLAMVKYSSRFRRSNTPLMVILASDEQDKSCLPSISGGYNCPDSYSQSNASSFTPISAYVTAFNNFQGVTFYPVVRLPDVQCINASTSPNLIGSRYTDTQVGMGTGKSFSVCEEHIEQSFLSIPQHITEKPEYACYLLSKEYVRILSVSVAGVSVPQDSSNGYVYDSTLKSVCFKGSSVPRGNDPIQIKYEFFF